MPEPLQVVGEHPVGAEQRLDAHRGGDVGMDDKRAQVVQREQQHAEHALGAVDEREAFLLRQLHRLDPRRLGCGGAFAFAHQRQCDVRERGEVAAATERSELPHHRSHAGVEQRGQPLGDDRTDAGTPGRERL